MLAYPELNPCAALFDFSLATNRPYVRVRVVHQHGGWQPLLSRSDVVATGLFRGEFIAGTRVFPPKSPIGGKYFVAQHRFLATATLTSYFLGIASLLLGAVTTKRCMYVYVGSLV